MTMTARQNDAPRGDGWLPWDEWDQMCATHDYARTENGQKCLFQ